MTAEIAKVVSGPAELRALGLHLRALGASKVLILCGPTRRYVDRAIAALDGLDSVVFDGAQVHVPQAVVVRAQAVLADSGADVIVAIGGGAATGLGKVLRLNTDVPLVAVPTTYAGSEMTRIWGTTDEGIKQTGRHDRVRPRLILLDPELTRDMPPILTVQSLLNALAHPVSALARAGAGSDNWEPALAAIRRLVRALKTLVTKPTHQEGRWLAMRGAAAAGRVLDSSELGAHHSVAHALGGRFGAPHAALHSILLPAFLAFLREHQPARFDAIARAAATVDLVATLHDALLTVGAPTGLRQLDIEWDAAVAALRAADLEDESVLWVRDAYLGRRRSACTRQESWVDGAPPMTIAGPPLEEAERVIVALHGRGSTADAIVGRARELVGDALDVAIVAPQAADCRWYGVSYREAAGTSELEAALHTTHAVLARVRAEVDPHRIFLFGFSQGACLALEAAARLDAPLGGVVALSGSRVGPHHEDDWTGSPHLDDTPMLLGIAADDPWASVQDVERTAAHFAASGAHVTVLGTSGDAHEITARQRLAARAMLAPGEATRREHGFGNHFEMETLPGALPRDQNSPRVAPYGLMAEQINGTGSTASRSVNLRSWLYRIRPAAGQRRYDAVPHATLNASFVGRPPDPNLSAIAPLPIPQTPTDFVDGLHTVGGAGDPSLRHGYAVHVYVANRSMEQRAFYNADGDFMILPQLGTLTLLTELGALEVSPGEIAIVPRGMRVSVLLHGPAARGYVGEVFGRHFALPERGPIGSNGLADARHFRAPTPYHENRLAPGYRIAGKLGGVLWEHTQDHSPFDVVAWHGNYAPMAYDLALFSPVSTVRIDHADPSIYTVMSAPMDETGSNALDLVIFPPRWDATEHTFRPPFFHRNATMEINGILRDTASVADASDRRVDGGTFSAGMVFVTPPMTPHGVVAHSVDRLLAQPAEAAERPHRHDAQSLWFQFESALPMALTDWALRTPHRMEDWDQRWGVYTSYYEPKAPRSGTDRAGPPPTPTVRD